MPEKKSLGPQGLVGFKDFIRLDSFPTTMLKLWSAISAAELCQGTDKKLMAALFRNDQLDSASPEHYSDPQRLIS